MKYRDEFRIGATAVFLSLSMLGISVVVPKESRIPTAKTTLTEAPETAAEAEQQQQAEFPIYTQESNYDTSWDDSTGEDSQSSGQWDDSAGSGDDSSSGNDQITYPTEDSGDNSDNSDAGTGLPDYTEDPSEDYGDQGDDSTWDDSTGNDTSGDDSYENSDGSDSGTDEQDMIVYE